MDNLLPCAKDLLLNTSLTLKQIRARSLKNLRLEEFGDIQEDLPKNIYVVPKFNRDLVMGQASFNFKRAEKRTQSIKKCIEHKDNIKT